MRTTWPTGALDWNVRSSFVDYVRGTADGRVDLIDCEDIGTGFRFAPAPKAERLGLPSFRGAVRFTGHHGMMAVEIAEPAIGLSDDGLVLTVADQLSPGGRLTLAVLPEPLVSGSGTLQATPVLTDEGADLFFEYYSQGSELDPLTIHVGGSAA